MGFLKGFLRKAEEEIADILPGGKTGKSIRAQRKAPVAKTVSRPRDESKSWLSKDFNPVSDGINDIKSAFKYASKDWKASEFQRQQDTQNANRQILKKYTQGQLSKSNTESLLGSKTKNAGLKKQGNLYVNTVKNGVGETLLQNTGAGIMNAAPQRVVGGLAEYGGTALGNDSIRDFGTKLNQPFRDYNSLAYENAGNKTAAIGGNIAGNLLTLPIAPAGKAGLAYRGVVAGAPVAADTGYAIKQAGGGRVAQTVGGGATGIASGYLNSVGGDKLLKPVGAVTSKLVGKTVTTKLAPTAFGRIGAGVLNEGGEEVIEQGVDNAVAKATYDPDRKLTDNLATSFLLGGAMGGVVRGGVELGNPTTRTQLINESKIKDIAGNQGGFIRISEDPIIDVESKLQKLNPNLDTNSLSDQQKRIALANIEQQQGRVNTDTGRKMFGSKKDLAKLRRINTENIQEIENQGERVAAKMVTKARVLGEDAKYTVNRSGDPAVENYKKLATSAIPSAPAQNAEARAWYVENVPKYIEKVKSANSIEEIEIAGRNLVNSANVEKTMMTYDNQERKYSSNDSRKWLGSRSYNMLRGYSGAMRTAKYRPPTDFSFDEKKASTKTGTDGTTKPQIHGGEQVPYERVGAQQLKNKDPKSMVKDFGFKGLEYGNYVKDTEASNHMTRFGDSMMDLETALDIDFTALNKQMDVGVGFGSRGTGKALAHYEPSNKVINITKKNTVDGSLAHEYMHGIDDFLSESKTGGKYASNGRAVKPATKEAMDTLMRAIREGDGSYKKTIQSDGTDRSSRQWSQVDSFIEEANGNGQLAMDNLQKRYPGSSSKSMNSVAQHIMSKTNMTSIKIPTGRSEFYDLAKEQGAYWERPTEMLARAFDGYIGNKLDQAGIKNNYVAKGSRQPGLMHPSEAHAQQLEPLFDNLFKAIKSDYNLPSPTQRATAETAETTKSADPKAPQVGKTDNIVYHGKSLGGGETGDRYGKGLYVTSDKNRASGYAKGGAVDEYSLDGSKLANLDDKVDGKIVDTLKREINDSIKNGDDYYKDAIRMSVGEKTFSKTDIASARKFVDEKRAIATKLGLGEDSMPTTKKNSSGDFTITYVDDTLESLKNIDGNRLFRSLPSPTAQSLFTAAGFDGVSYRGMGGDIESVIYNGKLNSSTPVAQVGKTAIPFNSREYVDTVIKADPEVAPYISKVKRSPKGDGTFVYMKREPATVVRNGKIKTDNSDAVYFFDDNDPNYADELYKTIKAENDIVYKDAVKTPTANPKSNNVTKTLAREEVVGRWQDGKTTTIDGKEYTVGKTSYGQYYAEPKGWQGGETDGFAPGTKWLEQDNKGQFEIVVDDDFTRQGVIQNTNSDQIQTEFRPKQPTTAPQVGKTVAPVKSKPTVTKKPTLQDALDGKSTKLNKPAPKKTVTEPKVAPVEPKRTEPASKKPFIPDEIKPIRAKREANTSQQNQSDQKRKNQQALRSKSSLQSQPESKVAPRTGVQPISEAVQGRVNNKSPQKARQGIGSIGKQKSLSGLSSKDTIQLSGVNVNDPFNNNKITKRLKNEFGRYFVDEDAEMINLMKRIEKETGQKDLVETWLQDSDLVRNTNSIANSKIRRNENLKLALRGLSKQQQRSFDEYASARTELSNLERGLESSSKPRQELERIVRDGNVDFGNRFIALNNYYGDWAKDLHDAGIISKSKLDEWSKNKDYVRVQRDMEDILNYTPPTGKSRSFGTTSTSKKRTGSKREILSPTNIALERGQQLQLEIQRNKAASNTIDTLEKYGLAEKVSQQHATGKNVIKRFKDGKVEYFATSKDVKRVIENVNPFQLGVLGRVISTPTRLFRSGTTALSAPFATTNYARDQVSSAIYSKDVLATHNPKNIVSGIASATKDYFGESSNPLWAKFEQVAGDQTQFDEMRNTSSSRATMRELRQGGKGELINKIVNPVRSMEDLIGITEKATRFQNFKGTYEAEMKRSGNEKIATQKASQAALQNSVNFTRAGKAMRVINLLLPYSNAGIQGSRNVARSFRSRPVATTMKSVAFVAVPTVLLTLMNYDDEETAKVYKNIDDTEKDDNFIIVLKGAKQNEAGSYEGIIKIPKPQGYRELTNPLRIAAERFAGNEKPGDVSKMVRDAMSAFTGPVSIEDSGKFISSLIPQAVKPTLQAMENKDYYWDSQTVPDYMIDGTDDPTKRAYKSTSGTARIIADQLGVSPILVEKFIQDTTGSVGRYGINLTDRGLNKLGIVKDEQIGGRTITGDFKRRTTEARAIEKTNKTSGQRYYDNVEKATGDLPKYLQDSWKSYNTSNKNFLGEELFTKNGQAKKQAKAAAYIEHPELFDVDKKLDKLNRKKGETGNPLYDLSYNQALIVVQEKALPPGAKDEGLNALYDQQWYSQYKNKEEKYYDKIFGKGGIEENKDNPYPERSPDLISAMDYYYDLPSSYDKGAWKKANPDIASQMDAYYSAKDAWTNTERAKIGLPPIEDRFAKYGKSSGKSSSSGGRGGSRSGGRSSSGGSRKGKFDYKFGAFAPGDVGTKKSLRKILEEAQL